MASRFFGSTVSSRQLIGLVRDAVAEHINDAPDMGEIREYAEQLEKAARDFRLSLGDAGQKSAWSNIYNKKSVALGLRQLDLALQELEKILQQAADRSRGLEQCSQRAASMLNTLAMFDRSMMQADSDAIDNDAILWCETYSKSFMLHATPVDIAALFKKHTDDFACSWLFTSATLQVNQSFKHFAESLGLGEYCSGVWHSPFDYKQQSLLYLPKELPEPSDSAFTRTMIDKAVPVLQASKGHAFLLFTSFRALNEAQRLLRTLIDFPVFVQGDLPKHELLAQFRNTANAVLLGTSSFWEGVDVRGEALSCVIIDKLPFASPGDPVMQARIDALRRNNKHPFMEYQVPQAVIALKRGVGRLIRDVNDRGVVMIADPRLTSKAYGKVFLNSLPDMPVTDALDDVIDFYTQRTTGNPIVAKSVKAADGAHDETACN